MLEKTALGSDVIDFYSDWMDSSASNYETKSLIWPDLNSNKLVDLIQLTKDNLPQQKSLLCSLLFI